MKGIYMKQGFTLIEMLVVVLIIGILAAIALPQYQRAVEKARAMKCVTGLEHIAKAYELWYMYTGGSGTARDFVENSDIDFRGFASFSFQEDNGTAFDNDSDCSFELTLNPFGADLMAWPTGTYSLEIYYTKGQRTFKKCFTQEIAKGRFICEGLGKLSWEYVDDTQ